MDKPNTPRLKQHGQALVEFTLILPTLLLVILAIFDYGRILFVFANATNSLRQATRIVQLTGLPGSPAPWSDCALLFREAQDIRFARVSSVDIWYYTAASLDFAGGDTFDTAFPLAEADFTCEDDDDGDGDADGKPEITSVDVENGDIVQISINARIDFITPFLSNVWDGIDLKFEARRSILTIVDLSGSSSSSCSKYQEPHSLDRDYDGLCDGWEFDWFGCLDDAGTVIQPLDVPAYTDDCAIDTWKRTDNGQTVTYFVPALDEYTATDDPDNDGCNNGCEETRGTKPINDANGPGDDTDRDGLKDADEVFIYFTNPSGEDKLPAPNGDGVPDGYDTDGDGLKDGEEVFPTLHGYGPTDPTAIDRNTDGIADGYDTDGDGLNDGDEVLIHNSSPNHIHTDGYRRGPNNTDTVGDSYDDYLEVKGFDTRDADPDNHRFQTISTTVNGDTSIVWANVITDPYKLDTDEDGLNDNCEFLPTNCDPLSTYLPTDPRDEDTDGDGMKDGEEITESNTGYRLGHFFLPTERDDDDDGVNDLKEWQNYADPQDENSDSAEEGYTFDGIVCSDILDDYQEIFFYNTNPSAVDRLSPPATLGGTPIETPDGDADGIDTDYDGLTDCEEVLFYTTNPNNWDTDGDGINDKDDPLPKNPDNDVFGTDDTDNDSLPDGWELFYFKNWPTAGSPYYPQPDDLTLIMNVLPADDPDADGCNNECELVRGTNPTLADSDLDGLLDNEEPTLGTDPAKSDSDGDGLNDFCELRPGVEGPTDMSKLCKDYTHTVPTNPRDPDSDDDGLTDYQEVAPMTAGGLDNYQASYGQMDAWDPDSDDDGLTDYQEAKPTTWLGIGYTYGASNPNEVNTDNPSNNPNSDLWTDQQEMVTYFSFGPNPRLADTDNDGLVDSSEFLAGTTITDADSDNDGLLDGPEYYGFTITIEFCYGSEVTQLIGYKDDPFNGLDPLNRDSDGDAIDVDGDGVYDANSIDVDGDGVFESGDMLLFDGAEVNGSAIGADGTITNPTVWDTDLDDVDSDLDGVEFSDAQELLGLSTDGNPTDPVCPDASDDVDSDLDGLTNGEELTGSANTLYNLEKTSPFDPDSDNDLQTDGNEVKGATFTTTYIAVNGSSSSINATRRTNPNDNDTDNDGLHDGREWGGDYTGTVFGNDSDPDTPEYTGTKTDPTNWDTDGDGISDYNEMRLGLNPLNGQIEKTRSTAVVASNSGSLTNVLNAYWNLTLVTPTCDSLCQGLTVANANSYDIRLSDNKIRLLLLPAGTNDLMYLFGADAIFIRIDKIQGNDYYEGWFDLDYLADVVIWETDINGDFVVETIRKP